MSWDNYVVVKDSDLARFEPEATHVDQPWGQASWPTQIEQAKRTLRAWIDADYGHIIGASDRIREHFTASHVKIGFEGSSMTDAATEAADPNESDIELDTAIVQGSSFLYVGSPYTFNGVYVRLFASGVNATAFTLRMFYASRGSWVDVPALVDGTAKTSGTPFGQSGALTWDRITDWERRSLDGSDEGLYWVRFTNVGSSADAGTDASQILLIRRQDGLVMIAAQLALSYIMRGLAAQMEGPWVERADAYLERANDLYARMKLTGSIPFDADSSGAVEPSEVGSGAMLALGRMPRA